jgi:hypothetical protein
MSTQQAQPQGPRSTLVMLPTGLHLTYDAMYLVGFDEDNIKKGTRTNGAWTTLPDPIDARCVLIEYATLPPVTKRRVDAYYPNIYQAWQLQQLLLVVASQRQPADAQYFTELPVQYTHDLVRSCAWLRTLALPTPTIDQCFEYRKDLYSMALTQLQVEKLYGLRVKNARVLMRRIAAWKTEQYTSLVNQRFGHKNASKAKDQAQEIRNWLAVAYGQPTKPHLNTVYVQYMQKCMSQNWPIYTKERVRQILNEPAMVLLYSQARHGKQVAVNSLRPTIARRQLSAPNELWSIDGTTLQLYASVPDSNGRQAITKLVKVFYMVLVSDVATGCIVGGALGTTETADLVQKAIRKAVQRNMQAPRFAHYDHGAANKSEQVKQIWSGLESVGILAQPHNGKAKHAENTIRWFEGKILRQYGNFVGGNVTAGLQSRANPDYLDHLLKTNQLPSAKQVAEQFEEAITEFNNLQAYGRYSAQTRIDAYMAHSTPERTVSELTVANTFLVLRSDLATYDTDGIRLQVNKERLLYVVESAPMKEDLVFKSQHGGNRFKVRFDPDNTGKIYLYDRHTDGYLATAVVKHQFGAIPAEWEENEGPALAEIWSSRDQLLNDAHQRWVALNNEYKAPAEAAHSLLSKEEYNDAQAEAETLFLNHDLAKRLLDPEP